MAVHLGVQMSPNLEQVFERINRKYFDGFLEQPTLVWNSRLRSSAGRFIPGSRKYFLENPAIIELASYLLNETAAEKLIEDTIAHEMIHYWLWLRKRPYGHTDEFFAKMKLIGCSRYNTAPRLRPVRYIYHCASCEKPFPVKKILKNLACSECCRKYSNGKYDRRFQLLLRRRVEREEGLQLAREGLLSLI